MTRRRGEPSDLPTNPEHGMRFGAFENAVLELAKKMTNVRLGLDLTAFGGDIDKLKILRDELQTQHHPRRSVESILVPIFERLGKENPLLAIEITLIADRVFGINKK